MNALGNVSEVRLDELCLDAQLQCRVEVDQSTVDEYAEAMRGGAEFPHILVIREQLPDGRRGRDLVVDGWHRVHAAQKAERQTISAEVREGTFRQALRYAVSANANHGLRRSNDDKRRAVRVLLMDDEWCALSSRELGAMASVSHAFINKVRKHYGLTAAERLTDAIIERVDGELPPKWAALVVNQWLEADVRKVRAAKGLKDLEKLLRNKHSTSVSWSAVELRLPELATTPWPWPEDDPDQRGVREAGLDDQADIGRAVLSVDCTNRFQLFKVWFGIAKLRRAENSWSMPDKALFQGRAALVAEYNRRKAELNNKTSGSKGPLDGLDEVARREYFGRMSKRNIHELADQQWLLSEGEGRLVVDRARELGMDAPECLDPRCDSSALGKYSCLGCGRHQSSVQDNVDRALKNAGELLATGTVELEVDGTPVRGCDVALLATLQAHPKLMRILAVAGAELPAEDAEALEQWAPRRKATPLHLEVGDA